MVQRAALYERVSTEEQALHGLSIDTQKETLEEYCQRNNIKIVDHYTDAGVSGGKPVLKRPEMARLVNDIEQGKIDIVLFTKLDRWFRNVTEYFKTQEILDKHNVQWKAVQEDYDTTTSNGRFAITIFLAVAENERERTADRVKVVFDRKKKKGEVLGRSVPFGYKKEGKRLVKDEAVAPALDFFFKKALATHNIAEAGRLTEEAFGLGQPPWFYDQVRKRKAYYGSNGTVDDYCEPYITKEQFLSLKKNVKRAPSGRVYLFSGLVKCPKCGRNMICDCGIRKNDYKVYLRCRLRNSDDLCGNREVIPEEIIETALVDQVSEALKGKVAKITVKEKKPEEPKTDIKRLREKLRRLDMVYINGNMPDEEYLHKSKELKEQIAEAERVQPKPKKDLSELKKLMGADFRTIYESLDRKERQRLWHSIVKEIHIEGKTVKSVDYL